MKICFAASSGGHFEQLMMLKPLMEKYESFVVTEKTGYEVKTPVKCYYLQQVNRRQWRCLFYLLKNTVDSLRLLHKEQPDVVVCTHPFPAGAASSLKGSGKQHFLFATVITDYSVK